VLKNEIFYIKMLGINIRRGASPPSEPLPEQAVTDGALRRISVEVRRHVYLRTAGPLGSLQASIMQSCLDGGRRQQAYLIPGHLRSVNTSII
ncbi:MAG: hypothetical protein ACKOAD_06280, partial [Gammaproteobacteria bacterium]